MAEDLNDAGSLTGAVVFIYLLKVDPELFRCFGGVRELRGEIDENDEEREGEISKSSDNPPIATTEPAYLFWLNSCASVLITAFVRSILDCDVGQLTAPECPLLSNPFCFVLKRMRRAKAYGVER
jgi:hypothetical protein